MNAVIAELDSNLVALSEYINSLKNLLIGLYDADVWETSEWDWQWPEHFPPDIQQTQINATAPDLPASVVSALLAAYVAYGAPPALDSWASQWDGSETHFLRFMCDKLEDYRAEARSRFQSVRQALLLNVS